jgi:hypothetical protein
LRSAGVGRDDLRGVALRVAVDGGDLAVTGGGARIERAETRKLSVVLHRREKMRPRPIGPRRRRRHHRKQEPRGVFPSQVQRRRHRVGARPEHRPLRVADRQPHAVPLREGPRGEVQLDVEIDDLPRLQGPRLLRRDAVRSVEPGAGHQRHRAVGRDIRQAHEPVRQRGIGRHIQDRVRQPEDLDLLFQRRAVVDQAQGVGGPLVRGDVPPPHHRSPHLGAGGGHIAQLVRPRFGRSAAAGG